jgi:mono/diheme cytochrome c family protein
MFALAWLAASRGDAGETNTPAEPRGKGTVTFNKDVAPLLFRRCASCHRPGEVAPFPLLGYRDASRRAGLIQDVTAGRIMPPWKPEPGSGHFAGERRLTDDEIAMIARWVQDGVPEGDPADLPPPPRFADGWQLGEPDMVVKMEEPYALAAEGPDVYRCFVIPLQVPSGKYLKAVEYRPGNRRIVHHALHAMLPHRAAQAKLAAGDGKSFGSGLAPPGKLLPGQLGFWTPGMEPQPLPDGFAAEWPEGSDLVLQLHLHPSGKPETEQSSIGLHFTDQKPRGRLRLAMLSNKEIDIEPGDAEHVVKASMTIKEPVEVYGVFPHMHLIGRTVKATATLPDGSTEPLISIGDWDFNWQYYYRYASPLRLPAGTKLEGRWTYDNSDANPANPSRPPKRVTYGEQTANEMAILILDVTPVDQGSRPSAAARDAGTVDFARRAADAMRKLDKDGDGKLGLDEIVTAMGDRESSAELEKKLVQFDRDNDKQLNPSELAEALKALTPR